MRKTISVLAMVMMTLAGLLAGIALPGADRGASRPAVQALLAADGEAPAIVRGAPISPSDVVPALMAVRARWSVTGQAVQQLRKLDAISIEITDLPGATLAEARGSSIAIDRTAAGWGWYVDPTPLDDAEFDAGAASAGAAGRIDLLTAIVHEMLHGLGRTDLDPALHPDDVMAGSLPRGIRRLTSAGGPSANVIAPSFTLPAGRSVTITLDATINKPFPFGVNQVGMQASISATGLPTVVSDNPSTGAANDPTITAVSCPVVTVSPASIPGATAGQPYSQTFTQSGGPGVVTFSVTGTLPAGVTFNAATATLSGTPTQTGSFSFTVTATSENGCSVGSRSYTLLVACPVITIAPASLPNAIVQRPYGPVTLTASGGVGTTTLALTGTLPPGLTFTASTGVISGTATDTGSFTFTITATDQNGCTGTRSYTLLSGGARIITTGADILVPPLVRRFTSGDGVQVPGPTGSFTAFGFSQGVRVAEADMNGDGVADIITGSGPGVAIRVVIYDGVTGGVISIRDVGLPIERSGVFVAAGDVDGDGKQDVITINGDGLPFLRVFSGASGVPLWLAPVYPVTYSNGARVAAGDVNGDGYADVITAPGFGNPGVVKVFSGASHDELRSMTPYPGFTGGIFVAAGDVNADGYADVITGADAGGGPHVRVYDGRTNAVLLDFYANAASFTGGVRVAAGDVTGDGRADIITAPGEGGDGGVRMFDGVTGAQIGSPIVGPIPAVHGLFVSTAVPENRMVIDAPAAGATVHSNFRVRGWVFEEGAPGTGVDAVHVWAYPVSSGSPVFLGAATLGDPRPDVGAIFGPRYTPSGYHLDVTGLAHGRYDIVVFARNSASGVFNQRRLVRVRVVQPGFDVRLAVDAPQAGAVHQNFRLAGYAFDEGGFGPSSGVDAVHVWAQKVGGVPFFLGVASLGDPRPDVADSTGMPVAAESGYHLDVAGLPAGDYTLMIFAKSAALSEFTAAQSVVVSVTTSTPSLQMAVDIPAAGLLTSGTFTVAGWALTLDAPSLPGVDAVHVWAYPVAGGAPTFAGSATLGGWRPDVGTIYGAAYDMSGFTLAVSALPSGTWDLAIYARSTGSPSFGAVRVVRVTVP